MFICIFYRDPQGNFTGFTAYALTITQDQAQNFSLLVSCGGSKYF